MSTDVANGSPRRPFAGRPSVRRRCASRASCCWPTPPAAKDHPASLSSLSPLHLSPPILHQTVRLSPASPPPSRLSPASPPQTLRLQPPSVRLQRLSPAPSPAASPAISPTSLPQATPRLVRDASPSSPRITTHAPLLRGAPLLLLLRDHPRLTCHHLAWPRPCSGYWSRRASCSCRHGPIRRPPFCRGRHPCHRPPRRRHPPW